jgi:hypothetical protein
VYPVAVDLLSQCQRICDSQPTCNGIFLGAAGDCHTVNATNVAMATSLEGVSYRRKHIGMPLVPNDASLDRFGSTSLPTLLQAYTQAVSLSSSRVELRRRTS